MFPDQTVTATQVRENLLRKSAERSESGGPWDASQELSGIDIVNDSSEPPLPIQHIMPTGSAILTI